MFPSRRQFMQASALLACGTRTHAIDPVQRNGHSHMRLSIAAYSYRKYLDLKNPTMTLDEFIDGAAEMDVDAVELTAYYFPRTTPDYLAHLKGRCTRLGLDVSGTAVGNNFCVADAEKLKSEIAKVNEWIEHSSRLGAKTLRIFAGTVDKADTEANATVRCIDAIHTACEHAAKFGVFLALENHGGITADVDQMLALVASIKHDFFGVNWDSGNFHSADPYADLKRLAPYAVNAQIEAEMQRKGAKKEPADMERLIGILRASGYRGYVALEYEAGEEPKTAVPRHVAALKKWME